MNIDIPHDHPVPVVFVTVGTMHHHFDRLMDWVESWLTERPGVARVIVQHATSRLPTGAEGFAMCSRDELIQLTRTCDIILTQGGPGGIMDSRDCGIEPIVVPRRAEFDEHVDDHQVRFCAYMAKAGLIQLADSQEVLHRLLDEAVAHPDKLRVTIDHADVDAAVARIGELVEDLVSRRPARYRRGTGSAIN